MKLKTNKIFFLLFILIIISLVFVSAFNIFNKNILKVTEEHPFLLNGKWIPASELKVGDKLVTATGKKAATGQGGPGKGAADGKLNTFRKTDLGPKMCMKAKVKGTMGKPGAGVFDNI